jgi:hypothetical protein
VWHKSTPRIHPFLAIKMWYIYCKLKKTSEVSLSLTEDHSNTTAESGWLSPYKEHVTRSRNWGWLCREGARDFVSSPSRPGRLLWAPCLLSNGYGGPTTHLQLVPRLRKSGAISFLHSPLVFMALCLIRHRHDVILLLFLGIIKYHTMKTCGERRYNAAHS